MANLVILIRREALEELKQAREWYASQDERVSRRFLKSVDVLIERLQHRPTASVPVPQVPELRRRKLPGFPYWVVFEESPGSVLIVAVAHERRRPFYWRER